MGEVELLREVERYQLCLPGLVLTRGSGSGASLERGWTLFQFGVGECERWWAAVGIHDRGGGSHL